MLYNFGIWLNSFPFKFIYDRFTKQNKNQKKDTTGFISSVEKYLGKNILISILDNVKLNKGCRLTCAPWHLQNNDDCH